MPFFSLSLSFDKDQPGMDSGPRSTDVHVQQTDRDDSGVDRGKSGASIDVVERGDDAKNLCRAEVRTGDGDRVEAGADDAATREREMDLELVLSPSPCNSRQTVETLDETFVRFRLPSWLFPSPFFFYIPDTDFARDQVDGIPSEEGGREENETKKNSSLSLSSFFLLLL